MIKSFDRTIGGFFGFFFFPLMLLGFGRGGETMAGTPVAVCSVVGANAGGGCGKVDSEAPAS